MRLRTFTAADVAEAMAAVRAALGDEAIIVSTRRGPKGQGVEVTAATDGGRDETEIAELEARLEASLRARLNAPLVAEAGTPDRDPAAAAAAEQVDLVRAALAFHRPPPSLAEALGASAARFDVETAELALAGALDNVLAFAPIPVRPARSIVLVGPPGSGKSVTAAKLVARAMLAGGTMRLVTTDCAKAGAEAQMRVFARVLGQRLATPGDCSSLAETQRRAPAASPAIVDTPGFNPFDAAERDEISRLIAAAEAEPVLVVAAGGDALEAAEMARVFARLRVRRAIVTRLDVGRRLGGILGLASPGGLALCEASRSPYVAGGLVPLDPVALARLILRDCGGGADPALETGQAAE